MKRVVGVLSFRECVLTTVNNIGGFQSFGVRFVRRKSCRGLTEVRRVRFENGNAYRQPTEVWRVCFCHRKACLSLTDGPKVRFDHRKAWRRLAEVWRVCFDKRNACRRLIEFSRTCFDHRKAN